MKKETLFVARKSFSGTSCSSVLALFNGGSSSFVKSLGLCDGGAGGWVRGRTGGIIAAVIGTPGMNGGRIIGGTPMGGLTPAGKQISYK